MLYKLCRYDHIANLHVLTQSAGHAGKYDALHRKRLDQCGGSCCGRDFADTRQSQYYRLAAQGTEPEFAPCPCDRFWILQLIEQALLFLRQRAEDGGCVHPARSGLLVA